VELQLEASVEIEPQSIELRFTRCAIIDLDLMNQDAESYGSNGFNAGQFNGPSGKCGLNAMSRVDSIKGGSSGRRLAWFSQCH